MSDQAHSTSDPQPPGDAAPMQYSGQSAMWRYRWAWGMTAALILGIAAPLAVGQFYPARYRAEAWLRIEDRRPYIAFPGVDASGAFARNQIEMIRSPVVLGEILSQRDIAQLPDVKAEAAPVEWLRDRVQVAPINNSEFFQISFEGPDPNGAAAIVNAVMSTYIEFQQKQAESQNSRIIDLLERTRETRMRELERLQQNVRAKTIQATGHDPGFVAPTRQVSVALDDRVRALEDKLTTIAVDRELARAKLKTMQEDFASQPLKVPESAIEDAIAADERLNELGDALESERENLKRYETLGVDKDNALRAKVDDAKAKVNDLQKRKDKLEQERRARYKRALERKLMAERESEIAKLQGSIEDQNLLEKTYQKELEGTRRKLENFGQQAFDLEIARGEMAYAEAVRDKIAERIAVLRTEQSAPTQVSRFRDAVVPVQRVDQPVGAMALAALGGFLLPIVGVSLWSTARQPAT